MTDFKIHLIRAEQVWPLRHKVLRPHQTLMDCVYPQDSWPNTFHVGAVTESGLVIGIATFHEERFAELQSKTPYRLRGMASDSEFQGRGIGRHVLEYGFQELKRRKCDLIWCNAREVAFPFYEKLGLRYQGPMFDIPTLGPHKVMYKFL